jgi:hypothetical protein
MFLKGWNVVLSARRIQKLFNLRYKKRKQMCILGLFNDSRAHISTTTGSHLGDIVVLIFTSSFTCSLLCCDRTTLNRSTFDVMVGSSGKKVEPT